MRLVRLLWEAEQGCTSVRHHGWDESIGSDLTAQSRACGERGIDNGAGQRTKDTRTIQMKSIEEELGVGDG